jgi:hypothetical protein
MILPFCEFSSKELIIMAQECLKDAKTTEQHAESLYLIGEAELALQQSLLQLQHNNGQPVLPPEPKDPWAWEDADTYGCSG